MQDALAEAAVQHAGQPGGPGAAGASRPTARRTQVVDRLRRLAEHRSNIAWERLGGSERETPSQAYVRLRREMLDAEREVFRVARDEGRIPEEVLVRAQRDLDLEESLLERRMMNDAVQHLSAAGATRRRRPPSGCPECVADRLHRLGAPADCA